MQSGKNEILLIKNLLKPVKIADRPAVKTDNEFESIKLRKTETLDDKIQEKSLSSHSENENEFFKVQLRKTKSPNEKDNDRIDAVSKKKDIKRSNKEDLLESASILRKKSEESQERVDRTDNSLGNIKLTTKECNKENYQVKETVLEKSRDKVKIPSHNFEMREKDEKCLILRTLIIDGKLNFSQRMAKEVEKLSFCHSLTFKKGLKPVLGTTLILGESKNGTDQKRKENSKIYVLFVLSFMFLLGLIIRRMDTTEQKLSAEDLFNERLRQNLTFNYDYFDIIKWP